MFRTALISLFITSTALATTWTVDDEGKADFDNIQAAVDASSDGDEIIVMPGTYTSTTNPVVDMLGKAVTLRSSDGPEVTIIDGQNTYRVIVCASIETSETVIEGLTITNGGGGGILTMDSNPTLVDCIITNNSGCGMRCEWSSPTLTDCTFTGNISFNGGGMWCNDSSSPTLTDCTFTSNSAYNGGGMYCDDKANPTLENCRFENNFAYENGGGMVLRHGGGVSTLTNCIFTANVADDDGGGLYYVNQFITGNVTLANCTFSYNTAKWQSGGGIHIEPVSNVIPRISDSILCGNTHYQIYGPWHDMGGNNVVANCPPCQFDINGDGYVNVTDLLAVIDQWGLSNSPADVNNDGIVNVSDLLMVISNWGECE